MALMRNMKRYLIITLILLFVIGWIATGSISDRLMSVTGYAFNYGTKTICIAFPIIVIVWLFYRIIKP